MGIAHAQERALRPSYAANRTDEQLNPMPEVTRAAKTSCQSRVRSRTRAKGRRVAKVTWRPFNACNSSTFLARAIAGSVLRRGPISRGRNQLGNHC